MKKVLSLIALVLGISTFSSLYAQNSTTLRFTGQGRQGAYVQLSSVEVKNLTRGWEETLVYPDTILMLGNVGLEDHVSITRFALSQNTPNPFRGNTDFSLQMPEADRVSISVFDINGKKITDLTQDLTEGIHIFRVILNTPQTYLVTAKTEHHSATIKIINQGSEAYNRIVYLGMGTGRITYEMGGDKNLTTDRDFEPGDLMRYVGKYVANGVEYTSDTILQPQYESQDFQLVFPCVPLNVNMFSATTCDGFTWNGQTYTQSGTYTQTFQGTDGCDSVVTLNLTVNQPVTFSFTATSCGDYLWNGQTYTQSGTYTQTFQGASGCDSVVTLNLTVNQPTSSELSATTCGSFTWNGQTLTQSGTYTQTFQAANGCDSVATLHLTITPSVTNSIAASVCGSYVWNGQTYTQSGVYTQTLQTVNGCDSVVTLNLTLNQPVTHSFSATSCGSYVWNGQTYTQSGTYTQTLQAANGCDSVVTLHLTVGQVVTSTSSATVCGSYVWNGQTYTQSGTYTQTFTAASGCDSVATLHLTVNQPVAHSFTASSCGSYVWNGQTYTQSGSYTQTFTAANGCDSVVTLHLTVNQPVTHSFAASSCGNYVWNGQTYTQTGTYTQTFTAANGCDSVATLHLTVNQPVTHSFAASSCGNYVWNGQTYTQSGTYTQTFQGTNGCDSVATLHLTVNQPVTNNISVTACGSYMWNGQTYTQSGTYTQTFTAANGCDSIVTLNLTVGQPVISSSSATVCGSYVWNGQTYTQSGTYTQTFTAANGCDSVVTLNLTVNQPVPHSFAASSCGSYVWNGQTYTQSGIYTQTFQAANGCDSVVTLNLTVGVTSLPTLSAVQVYGVSAHTANVTASVQSDGCSPVVSQGFCWGTQPNPVVTGSHVDCPTGMAMFFNALSGLEAGQTYYVRAYATNAAGTGYSTQVTFTTDSYLSFALLVDTPCTSDSVPVSHSTEVLEYCVGTDSVRLSIANYEYGIVQWQVSHDTVEWTNIKDANDTFYVFYPEESGYYRARMTYSLCPSEYSQTIHLHLTPRADAGRDRVLNADQPAQLFGNEFEDATGLWTVLSGDSAAIDDPTDPYALFQGPDSLYVLTWTLTNSCGTSTDTVTLRFIHTVFADHIVVVDTTDLILSDSAEMATGIYRIVFNYPVPTIVDSTILVGIPNGGFLRKVMAFEQMGDTVEMYTIQATLDDLIEEGALNFDGSVLNSAAVSPAKGPKMPKGYARLDHQPTRAELAENPDFQDGSLWCYVYPSEFGFSDGSKETSLNFSSPFFKSEDIGIVPQFSFSEISIHPKFITDFDFYKLHGRIHTYYLNKLQMPFSLKVKVKDSFSGVYKVASDTLDKDPAISKTLTTLTKRLLFFISGVPVEISVNFELKFGLDASATVTAQRSWKISGMLELGQELRYDDGEVTLNPCKPIQIFSVENVDNPNINLELELATSLTAKISLELYNRLGPYLSAGPKLSLSTCSNIIDYSSKLSFDIPWKIGLSMKGIKKKVFDINLKGKIPILKLKDPDRLERNVVSLQDYSIGGSVYHPVSFKVVGGPVSFFTQNRVHIHSSSGYIAETVLGNLDNHLWNKTDIDKLVYPNDIVNIFWKPNGSTSSTITVEVKDCEGKDIDYSPMIFHATTGVSPCLNTTLQLSVVGGALRADGGEEPYQYSSDGFYYSQTKPIPEPDHTYYVRDNNNCVAQFHTPEQPCDLHLTYQLNGTTVVAQAENGTPPYRFYLDGSSTSFATGNSPTATVASLSYDDHTIRVRDHKGCWATAQFTVTDGTYPPMLYVNPAYNSYKNIYTEVMSVVFDDGNLDVTERGIYYSTNQNMTPSTKVVGPLGNGMGPYLCSIPANIAQNPYYVCAYAVNSKGGTGYSDTVLISRQNSNPSQDGQSCPGTPTVTDHEGNVYATVQIGNQCWMRDNLRTTTSPSTGTYLIPAAGTDYTYTGKQARWYNNDSATYAPMNYGLLYNWNAAVDTFNTTYGETSVNTSFSNAVSVTFNGHRRGICPAGWHLPSDAEWTQLESYVSSQSEYTCGGNSNYIAKALASTEGWNTSTPNCRVGNDLTANNATGFSAVPAGFCNGSWLYYAGDYANFWSATQNDSRNAYYRCLGYYNAYVYRSNSYKSNGYSVRCLRDENNTGGTAVVDEKSCPAAPTVTDHEGNVYATVQIGSQCWMRDNLRTTTSPSTGTYLIPAAGTHYTYTGKQARWYNNDSATYAPMNYGLLYNWNAAVDTFTTAYGETSVNVDKYCAESVSFTSHRRGICPAGWHLPSDAEWTQLTNYVSSQSEYTCGGNSSDIVKALASTEGWNSYSDGCYPGDQSVTANNATGFSAVPAGYYGSSFDGAGNIAYFWCATQNYSSNNAYNRYTAFDRDLYYQSAAVSRYVSHKRYGLSVRCLRDEDNTGGTAVVDEKSCPGTPTVTDHEGNVYATVQIGDQCWMRDNLRTTTSPSTGTYLIPASGTGNTYTGKQAHWYNNDSATYASMNYGLLYNWNAAMDTFNTAYGETSVNDTSGNAVSVGSAGLRRGICPAGWHLPSNSEWTGMINYVRSQSEYTCGDNSYNVAKALASETGWNSCGGECNAGDQSVFANNTTGFSAVPVGYCHDSSFSAVGNIANFWSSLEHYNNGYPTAAIQRSLYCNWASVEWFYGNKYYGFSVRCLRDNTSDGSASLPTVTTNSVSGITSISATSGGNVTSDGGDFVTARGVCWSTSPNPTIADSHTSDGSGTGTFTSSITGLNDGTTYYARAYATNSEGTAYGEEVSFIAENTVPKTGNFTITTCDSWIYDNGGSSGDYQNSSDGYLVVNPVTEGQEVVLEGSYSVESDYDYIYVYSGEGISGTQLGEYTGTGTISLMHDGTLTIRFVSDGSVVDSGFSIHITCSGAMKPAVITAAVTNFTATSAACGGNVIDDNGYSVIARGVCWSTSPNPTIADNHTSEGGGTGEFTSSITGLIEGTTYYVRAYATNSEGTAYGEEISFIAENTVPKTGNYTITTCDSWIYDNGGSSGDYQNSSDGYLVVNPVAEGQEVVLEGTYTVESSYDHIYIYSGEGTSGTLLEDYTGSDSIYLTNNGTVTIRFTSDVSVVKSGFAIHVTCSGASSSNIDGQPCPGTPTVTDYDGNVYNTVQLGLQCWMKENMRATHYADGTGIPIGDSLSFDLPYRYAPDNDENNVSTYGYLYNWSAVMYDDSSSNTNPSGVQGICPSGWHVPSEAEWEQMIDYVGSVPAYFCDGNSSNIAKALSATDGWENSTENICSPGAYPASNNASGFSITPAGEYIGDYFEKGRYAFFWSSTESDSFNAWHFDVGFVFSNIYGYSWYNEGGYSVRCVLDGETSPSGMPAVKTGAVSSVTSNSATCEGEVIAEGNSPVSSRGICWSITPNPTISDNHLDSGSGIGPFSITISGVDTGVTYYLRAYATNSIGTAYGNQKSFTIATVPGVADGGLPCPGIETIVDVDGNVYNTVQIGSQCWMKENLRTRHYANGDSILEVILDPPVQTGGGGVLIPGGFGPCLFHVDNNSSNDTMYGLLYNWSAAMWSSDSSSSNPSGIQGACPYGWHVPSVAEWTQLLDFVSGESQYLCGNNGNFIAKSLSGEAGWMNSPEICAVGNNIEANNATGFSAIPAGYTTNMEWGVGYYNEFSNMARYWSTTRYICENCNDPWSMHSNIVPNSYYLGLAYNSPSVIIQENSNNSGLSVRCLRSDNPTVTTGSVTGVSDTSATCVGNVTDGGTSAVTARGVCWSTSPNPTLADNHTDEGGGVGEFTSMITGLIEEVTYYVRTYATNSAGTTYGEEQVFTMPYSFQGEIMVTFNGSTWAAANMLAYDYTDEGYLNVFIEKTPGCSATFSDIFLQGYIESSVGSWTYETSGGDILNYRDHSNNYTDVNGVLGDSGLVYWGWHVDVNSFYENVTAIDLNARRISGTFTENVFSVQDYISAGMTIPDSTLPLTVTMNNAHWLWKAKDLPTVTTSMVSDITSTSVVCGGNVTYSGGATVTERGVCWSSNSSLPTVNDSHTSEGYGVGEFTSLITGLEEGISYYVRAYATNNAGTAYGESVLFVPSVDVVDETGLPCSGTPTVTDHEGNVYSTVRIGDQCWMRENLRTTTSPSTGTYLIPHPGTDYTYTGKQAFWYNNDSATYAPMNYGLLYNWNAAADTFNTAYGETSVNTSANDAVSVIFNGHRRGICPVGWHLPSDTEWTQLMDYVSGQAEYVCGGNTGYIAKALASTQYWNSDNGECYPGDQSIHPNNSTCFSAVPAGSCSGSSFDYSGAAANFWSSSQHAGSLFDALSYDLSRNYANVNWFGRNKHNGGSVRCLRDEDDNGTTEPGVIELDDTDTVYLFQEDFETNSIPVGWTQIDANNDNYGWEHSSTPVSYFSSALSGHGHNSSNGFVLSGSYSNVTSQSITPDNWLITPAINLTSNATLTFWVCAQDYSYAAEHYGVYISTTGNSSTSDFTLLMEETIDANGGAKIQGAWKQKTVNLSNYTGQTVYIAFRHFNCYDQFVLNLDDVEVLTYSTGGSGETEGGVGDEPHIINGGSDDGSNSGDDNDSPGGMPGEDNNNNVNPPDDDNDVP